tara:strand:- start:934 stop:1221 length:288 start_codon:yes stop_codon:yes gene_type:complete
VLSEHNHNVPMQLGGFFVPAMLLNATHRRRPYAGLGAGLTLSRAALERVRWSDCMQAFTGSCMQADRMVGRCLEAAAVAVGDAVAPVPAPPRPAR